MALIEALSSPGRPVRRLLELALTWENNTNVDQAPSKSYRTACQLKPAAIDELVGVYQKGATTRELATRFGIWRGTVGKHLKDRGIDTRAPIFAPDDVRQPSSTKLAGHSGRSHGAIR